MAKRNIWEWLFGKRYASGGIAPPPALTFGRIPNVADVAPAPADAPLPDDEPERTLTDGSPVPEDNSHTQDRGDGQQKGYVVLSEAERAKGFVRPVRDSYVHVGPPPPANLRDLTEEERKRYAKWQYVKYETYPESESPKVGRYWTQAQLDRLGGCGVKTTMGLSIAETYARIPTFYGSTFCVGCGAHFPVGETGEFVWDGTNIRVGT